MKLKKFGGSSLADSGQVKKVIKIIRSPNQVHCSIVVSAPGKRNSKDAKVTDLLYSWDKATTEKERETIATAITGRYQEIIDGLSLEINFSQWFKDDLAGIIETIEAAYRQDYAASRGEYWMARIMAEALGYIFVDAKSFIAFDRTGTLNLAKTERLAKKIRLKDIAKEKGIVVPGFYGAMPNGDVKTFSRGGSDITGAIVALCVGVSIYENWTDVSGFYMADPRIVADPRTIEELTYSELRELAYRGADVLHTKSIFPALRAGIPINIKNTNRPEDKGTWVKAKVDPKNRIPGSIIGIAGRTGFSVIRIEKALMDEEVGFLNRVSQVLKKYNVNIRHVPDGIDSLSVIVQNSEFEAFSENILGELTKKCKPDSISVEQGLALICIVGSAMSKTPGVVSRIFKAIANAGINVEAISQGASPISVVIGVNTENYGTAIRAIYGEFTN